MADQFRTGLQNFSCQANTLPSVLRSLITLQLVILLWATPALGQYAQPHGVSKYGYTYAPTQAARSWPLEPSRITSIAPSFSTGLNQTAPVFAQGITSGYCGSSDDTATTCSPPECCPVDCVPCCKCACDESERQWALEVTALGLFRSDPASVRLLQNPVLTSEFVNASQFDFAAAAGFEAGLTIYNDSPELAVELHGMFPNEWQSTVRESFTGTSVSVEGQPPLVTTGPRDSTSVYESQFRSLMLNLKWKPDLAFETTWTLGLRSISLDESLTSTLVDPGNVFPDEVIRSVTDNQMMGIHFGLSHNLISTCDLCVKIDGRAGLFANDASQRSQLVSLATPPVIFPASGSAVEAAGVFEFGLEAKWKMTDCLNAVIGYRLMTLSGVSLASDQLPSVDFLNQEGLDVDSTLVLQSLRVGLELHY